MSHAVLSPSSASRWLECTKSARLEMQFPDRAGEAAAEGTLAHALGELLIREALGLPANLVSKVRTQLFKKDLAKIQANSLYSQEMLEHCENYATFVIERFSEAKKHTKDAMIFLEQKLDLTEFIEEGFGTGDVVIIADGVMDGIDLKYGKGVPVSAEENKQLMLYALGGLRVYDYMYDIRVARMTIFQPRLDSISTYEIQVADLENWAEEELKPKAKLAFAGEGDFVPGKHCQFCRAKATCRANAEYHMAAAKYEFKRPELLDEYEISDILTRAKMFENWLNAVQEYALDEAINGKRWPEFKLVEGRSVRVYSDEKAIADLLTKEGFTDTEIYNKKLQGITAIEKLLGKHKFNDLLSSSIIKPPGKPTLVSIDDRRPELNNNEAAKMDFAELVEA